MRKIIDRYNWEPENTQDGTLLVGPVSGKKLVWDADTLRYANGSEIGWNRGCVSYIYNESFVLENQLSHYKCTADEGWIFDAEGSSGTVKDAAGTEYRTIAIGTRRWMAENMNYEIEDNVCFDCEKYGRFYSYDEANRICPKGWRVPTTREWTFLFSAVGGSWYAGVPTGGNFLKSTSGWDNNGNGSDDFSFSILPAGSVDHEGNHINEGSVAVFWSTPYRGGGLYEASCVRFNYNTDQITLADCARSFYKSTLSLRCIEKEDWEP